MDNTEQRDFAEEAANRNLLREEDNLFDPNRNRALPEDPDKHLDSYETDFADYREDYGGHYDTDETDYPFEQYLVDVPDGTREGYEKYLNDKARETDHYHDPRNCRECSEKYGTVYSGKAPIVRDVSIADANGIAAKEYEARSLREVAERTPTVHIFASGSGRAYDITQTEDSIKDGNVLIVPSEGIVGLMYKAWPVALTSEYGQFHTFVPIASIEDEYNKSIILADSYIRQSTHYSLLDEDKLREKHNVHI